jgi:hypothetical protein
MRMCLYFIFITTYIHVCCYRLAFSTMQTQRLPSQIELQPYGHLICTPISCLVATTYIKSDARTHNDVKALFSAEYVKDIMKVSHELYSETFSQRGIELMVQDIYPWLTNKIFTLVEAAGLVKHEPSNTEVDDLVLTSLISLVNKYVDFSLENGCKSSIIVTAKGHTICYMCSENGELYVFDALPASLNFIPSFSIEKNITEHFGLRESSDIEEDVQYSAVVLYLTQL